MSPEHTSTPASADIDFLTHKINQETPEFGEAHPFAFFIRDEKNQIIVGCNGSVIFGSDESSFTKENSPFTNYTLRTR